MVKEHILTDKHCMKTSLKSKIYTEVASWLFLLTEWSVTLVAERWRENKDIGLHRLLHDLIKSKIISYMLHSHNYFSHSAWHYLADASVYLF